MLPPKHLLKVKTATNYTCLKDSSLELENTNFRCYMGQMTDTVRNFPHSPSVKAPYALEFLLWNFCLLLWNLCRVNLVCVHMYDTIWNARLLLSSSGCWPQRYQPQKDHRIRAAEGRTIRISQFKLSLHVHTSCTVCVFGRLLKTLSQKLLWHFSGYRNLCWYDKCLPSSHHVSRRFS